MFRRNFLKFGLGSLASLLGIKVCAKDSASLCSFNKLGEFKNISITKNEFFMYLRLTYEDGFESYFSGVREFPEHSQLIHPQDFLKFRKPDPKKHPAMMSSQTIQIGKQKFVLCGITCIMWNKCI